MCRPSSPARKGVSSGGRRGIVESMGSIKKKVTQKLTDQQRIEFAKQIEYFYEASHADAKKIFGQTLLRGIATGLGVFLGGTLVVALLLWMLSLFSNLPFVGDISQAAEHSIERSDKSANEQ